MATLLMSILPYPIAKVLTTTLLARWFFGTSYPEEAIPGTIPALTAPAIITLKIL